MSDTRRTFLRRTLAIVPLATLGACDAPKDRVAPTATPYVPRFFTPDEWAFVRAACGRLIPADDNGPGALEAGVPEFIDRQMETPWAHGALWYTQGPYENGPPELGYQLKLVPREIYRLGIARVDAHCTKDHEKRFAALVPDRRDAVLADLERGAIDLVDLPASVFFALLLQNTKEGFFADPVHGGNKNMVGWKLVGFPGARADFMDWVDQHGKTYPLGPVDLAGRRA